MAALVIVPFVALRMVASVREPTRLMPPQSPASRDDGDAHTWMKTEQPASTPTVLSRKLVKTLAPEVVVSLASSVAPVRLIDPFFAFTTPAGTLKVPPTIFRSPLSR